jgi:hypothetical protein
VKAGWPGLGKMVKAVFWRLDRVSGQGTVVVVVVVPVGVSLGDQEEEARRNGRGGGKRVCWMEDLPVIVLVMYVVWNVVTVAAAGRTAEPAEPVVVGVLAMRLDISTTSTIEELTYMPCDRQSSYQPTSYQDRHS